MNKGARFASRIPIKWSSPSTRRRLQCVQNVKKRNRHWKGMDEKMCAQVLVACVSLDIKRCLMMLITRQMVLYESGTSAVEPSDKGQAWMPRATGIRNTNKKLALNPPNTFSYSIISTFCSSNVSTIMCAQILSWSIKGEKKEITGVLGLLTLRFKQFFPPKGHIVLLLYWLYMNQSSKWCSVFESHCGCSCSVAPIKRHATWNYLSGWLWRLHFWQTKKCPGKRINCLCESLLLNGLVLWKAGKMELSSLFPPLM